MEVAEDRLRLVHSILSDSLIHNFMIPPTKHTVLSTLYHSLAQPYSHLVSFSLSSKPTLTPNPSPCLFEESSVNLFLAVLNTPTQELGFTVKNSHKVDRGPMRPRYMLRSFVDHHRGVLIAVAEHETYAELTCYRFLASGVREQIVAIIHPHAFRHIFTHAYDPHAMRTALISLFYSRELRPCPRCHGPVGSCVCGMSFEGMNRIYAKMNTHSMLGVHHGNTIIASYVDGKPVPLGSYITDTNAQIRHNWDTRHDLEAWAVWRVSESIGCRVTALCMPTTPTVTAATATATATDCTIPANTNPAAAKSLSPDSDVIDITSTQIYHSESECDSPFPPPPAPETAISDDSTYHRDDVPTPEAFFDHTDFTVHPGQREISRSNQPVSPAQQHTPPLSHVCAPPPPHVHPPPQTTTASVITPCQQQHLAAAPAAPSVPTPTPSLAPLQPAQQQQQQQSQRTQTILPRAVPVKVQVLMPRTADVEVGDRPLDARQKMLEARKIRNRESAYRSNERKKVREMRIEKDMQVLTEREMELREREQMLLEENRKLRAELGN